ncbi:MULTISPECIES: hypothetical protein [unclassified Acinetobacter]|uniref:hypothetical protein n=1 Tax=unclassified Acinetobacter TaxID=196816 RepID=UPI0015D12423|nr:MULTISPECIES: hypothetical protein [unclassified Acinetobacter]
MKTIRTIMMSTALLACTPLFANPDTTATSELKVKYNDQNTADHMHGSQKGMSKTRTAKPDSQENIQNFAAENAIPSKNSNHSHPSNMDINGQTHAELNPYSEKAASADPTQKIEK